MGEPPGRTTRLAAVAFGALLLATAGAFLLANRLKAQPAVLDDIVRQTYFSPNGDGRRDTEPITFSIHATDRAAVDVVDADGTRVKRVAGNLDVRPGRRVRVVWNGRDDAGLRAPDGAYSVRVTLRREGRSVLAPRPFQLDTRAPSPAVIVTGAPIVAPGRPVSFRVRGAGSSAAPRFTVLRTDVVPARTVRRIAGARGVRDYTWDARDDAGDPVAAGTYLIAAEVSDTAENVGMGPPLPLQPGIVDGRPGVTVRSLAVQPPVRAVRAGDPFSVRVDSRARAYSWSLRRLGVTRPAARGRRPAGRTPPLVLRAPRGPSGVYLLELRSRGAATRVPVAVQARARSGPLVVLPMITWLGRDPVDATGDGVPDTFASGSPVGFPRVFAYGDGLPAGFAADVAPLLVTLDRQGVRYDVTTDLALSFTDEPRPGDRRGVLLAGSPEWVSQPVAQRLRRFVDAGGRVATFAPLALRAAVTVGESMLSRPTPPTDQDALGGRIADVRRLAPAPGGTPPPLAVLEDDRALGLLEGFSGQLSGFSTVEELLSPGRGKVVTSVGEESTRLRPALSATTYGKGLVIRVGLPEWVQRLNAGDPSVEQITRNLVDLLRGVQPRARSAG